MVVRCYTRIRNGACYLDRMGGATGEPKAGRVIVCSVFILEKSCDMFSKTARWEIGTSLDPVRRRTSKAPQRQIDAVHSIISNQSFGAGTKVIAGSTMVTIFATT